MKNRKCISKIDKWNGEVNRDLRIERNCHHVPLSVNDTGIRTNDFVNRVNLQKR